MPNDDYRVTIPAWDAADIRKMNAIVSVEEDWPVIGSKFTVNESFCGQVTEQITQEEFFAIVLESGASTSWMRAEPEYRFFKVQINSEWAIQARREESVNG